MLTAAFILFISISVCCTVCQYMCSRTYITIIVFIICEGVFSKKPSLVLGRVYGKVVEFHLPTADWAIAGVLYPASATTICGFSLDILSYNTLKVRLSCSLPGCTVYPRIQPCLSQAVSTAYAKRVYVHPFEPSTFRIADAAFLCFHIFRKFFRYRSLIISGSTGCRWLVIIFFL